MWVMTRKTTSDREIILNGFLYHPSLKVHPLRYILFTDYIYYHKSITCALQKITDKLKKKKKKNGFCSLDDHC